MTWPHHVTIVPPFEADSIQLHDIRTTVDRIADTTAPFSVTGGRTDTFEGNFEVRLLADPRSFQELHEYLVRVVENATGRPVNSGYIREQYQPHVTHKKQPGWLEQNETRAIPGIDIVERDPDRGNLKIVLAHYEFVG